MSENAHETHNSDAALALPAGAEKSTAAARRRAGNRKGGLAKRAVALIGLGQDLPTLSLRSADDQLRVLEATLEAVARGKTSGLVCASIVSLVKAANQILVTEQAAEIAALQERIEAVLNGHTIR
jgi:hypothetical protein